MMANIHSFFTLRRIFIAIGAVVVVAGGYIWWQGSRPKLHTLTVHRGDFVQQASVSGNVTATQDLDLSFEQSGRVVRVPVKEGDKVTAGQVVAVQDASDLSTQLSEMQAGIDLQQAKLDQLLAGASPESIRVYEDAVTAARQDVKNAATSALNSLTSASTDIYNADTTALTMQNTYFYAYDQQGIKAQGAKKDIDGNLAQAAAALASAKNDSSGTALAVTIPGMLAALHGVLADIGTIRDQCDSGAYYLKVAAADKALLDAQKTALTAAISDITSAQQTMANDAIALQKAQSQLDSAKAPPRDSDVAVYKAQLAQAVASKDTVVAQMAKRQLCSPIDGVVTVVNAKVGSVAAANSPQVSVISSDALQIESFIPETYISLISVDDPADVTFDVNGVDGAYHAKVIFIDPAETLKDGVATYKTKLQFLDGDQRIKPGMTANVVVTTEKKTGVISVPQGIVQNRKGKSYVKVVVGQQTEDREITTGSVSSMGQIEVVSGLEEGDIVVLSQ